ncbi:hypothetical protein QTP88_013477 [Uroleucon formosanum]
MFLKEIQEANGSCNNLKNPLWGSSETLYIRLSEAAYNDGNYGVRKQSNGSLLPIPRKVQFQFGQWITHNITILTPDSSGLEKYPYQCQLPIELPTDDPVFGRHGRKCMEFRRAMTAANNFNCSITPQIPVIVRTRIGQGKFNQSFNGGRLITDVINKNEYCPLRKKSGSLLCDGRDNVGVCFEAGDPRINQHFGITSYSIVFTRFHNVVADMLHQLNLRWSDEVLYQEARKFVSALYQIIIYRDYLPILLVPHNTIVSFYNYVDKDYEIVDSVKLNEWMSIPVPLVEGSNLDEIISNFMFHNIIPGDQDLLSVEIQGGRDCGLPEIYSFEDLSYVKKLKELYTTVYDIDLLVGALLEPPVNGGTVGPTAQCILADVFYRIRYGDGFFFDVRGQPGSCSLAQLKTLRNMDLGHVICATTDLDEVPSNIFDPLSYSQMVTCQNHLLSLDLSVWRESP